MIYPEVSHYGPLFPVENWDFHDDSVNIEDFSKLCESNNYEEYLNFPNE